MAEDIAIFSDGSGSANATLIRNLQTIAEYEKVCKTNRKFIGKHKDKLAGSVWSVGYLEPEIEFSATSYRGSYQDAAMRIAKLFPDAGWERQVDEYSKHSINWVGCLDGVTLIIKNAERLPKPTVPKFVKNVELV